MDRRRSWGPGPVTLRKASPGTGGDPALQLLVDPPGVAEHHEPAYGVLQLPDVPGPFVVAEHLERIENTTGVRPVVNQIEVHPYFPQEEALAFHAERGILTEAWSPLGRAKQVLDEPVIVEIAQSHGISPVQAIIAWHVARGTVSIPKASSPEHQRTNLEAAAVVLDEAEVDAITSLGRPDGRLFDADPATHEEM